MSRTAHDSKTSREGKCATEMTQKGFHSPGQHAHTYRHMQVQEGQSGLASERTRKLKKLSVKQIKRQHKINNMGASSYYILQQTCTGNIICN